MVVYYPMRMARKVAKGQKTPFVAMLIMEIVSGFLAASNASAPENGEESKDGIFDPGKPMTKAI